MQPLQSLIASGTKLYLDSVDPQEVAKNLAWGAVGATSNPAIIAEIVQRGGFDANIESLVQAGKTDEEIAWALTNSLVTEAEQTFLPIWKSTDGNAGWVSFELDPLLEDPSANLSIQEQSAQYVSLGKKWAEGHKNRMIKVPATPGGIAALEELTASGITLNVTLIFTMDQYTQARDAVWRGAQRRANLDAFKSVYSIFVSRIDIYTEEKVPQLSSAAQGLVGIVNAQQIWAANQEFWKQHPTPLQQEIIFASTGTKKPSDPAWKYVAALAGSDIQTNPPQTNQAVSASQLTFTRKIDELPAAKTLAEIEEKVDISAMHSLLMSQGVDKFVKPQKALIKLIGQRRHA